MDRMDELVHQEGGFTRFAGRYEVHPTSLFRWVSGETRPGFYTLGRLARSGIDVNWLLGGKSNEDQTRETKTDGSD